MTNPPNGKSSRLLYTRLVLSTILCSGLATPSFAQTTATDPVTVDTVDENGVEMSTLNYVNRSEDVSIGTGEFPERLSLSRNRGFNVDMSLKVVYGTYGGSQYLVGDAYQFEMVIGGVKRGFLGSNGTYSPADGRGGEIRKTTESGVTVYTYYSTDGDELRFVVSNATACGRTASTVAVGNITCTKISKWTAPKGVSANFTYATRSEFIGGYRESDVTNISNSIGLRLALTYTRFKDNGNYSNPSYDITSAVASSDQLGVCSGQPTCSRTATYGYNVAPAYDVNQIGGNTNTQLASVADTLGNTTQYLRNTPLNSNMTWSSVRRPSNPSIDAIKVTYGTYQIATGGYDSITLTDAAGSNWTYTRTGSPAAGFVTTRTNPFGKSRVYTFDSKQNLVRFRDENLKEVQWQYDAVGRRIQETRPNGGITQWDSASKWSLAGSSRFEKVTIKAAPANPAPDIVTRADYPASLLPGGACADMQVCYKPSWTTDARGKVTSYGYFRGAPATVVRPEPVPGQGGPRTDITYALVSGAYVPNRAYSCRTGGNGCVGTADERRLTLSYGANGLLLPTQTTLQSGDGTVQATITNTYDAFGNRTSEDGPLTGTADTVRWIYDRAGKVLGEIGADPDGTGTRRKVAKRYSYDPDGRQTLVELGTVPAQAVDLSSFTASQASQIAYNANGQKIRETDLGAGVARHVKQYSYDIAGNVDCVALRMNSTAFASLPASACVSSTTGGAEPDRITKYTYDDAGRMTKVTTAYGTSVQADELTQDYSDNGKVAHVTDAKGNTTTYGYDGFDRLTTTTFPNGSYETLGYDPAGNVTSKRTRDGQTTVIGYDALNRIVSKDLPNSVSGEADKSYVYDNFSNLTRAEDSTGRVLTFSYDALGRKISQGDNFYAMGSASFAYNPAGQRTGLTWADGNSTTYDYRFTGEMSAIRNSGGTALVSFTYDDLGRRTGVARTNGAQSVYGYDDVSQLNQLVQNPGGTADDLTVGYTRNPAGQITRRDSSNSAYAWKGFANVDRGYNTNALNQITSAGNPSTGYVGYGYSPTGNLTSGGAVSFGYTVANQMVSGSGVAITYDPLDRLYRGLLDYGQPETALIYDGTDVIAEVAQANGAVLRRYVIGPGTDEPMVWYEGGDLSNPRWLHADERGSVTVITDASGNKIRINNYDEYGIPYQDNIGRFQYTGQKWYSNVGLYDYKNRIYSPLLGRFMQSDPIGYTDGLNFYQYAGNDPVNNTDPTGLSGCQMYLGCYDSVIFSTYNGGGHHDGSGGGNMGYYPVREYGPRYDFGGWNALWALRSRAPVNQVSAKAEVPQWKWPLDRCGIGYQVLDWSLWGAGVFGDGMSIVGLFTLQPELVIAGNLLSKGSNAGALALHASAGDAGAVAGDAIGFSAGLIPGGGTLTRKLGMDISRNAAGRYVKGQAGRYAAQDETMKVAQERYINGIAGSQGGCK